MFFRAPFSGSIGINKNLSSIVEKNLVIQNNTLEFINAENIVLKSISGFDSFSFPNNISNNHTIVTLSSQPYDINVDANKLTISNYDHFTSPLSINLIDAYGTYG
ncbi:MAG: hypothetical protein LBS29_06480, partial [Endomicrobium sp.]|nr:hypothetical protein [Endomicrobium sp.]